MYTGWQARRLLRNLILPAPVRFEDCVGKWSKVEPFVLKPRDLRRLLEKAGRASLITRDGRISRLRRLLKVVQALENGEEERALRWL